MNERFSGDEVFELRDPTQRNKRIEIECWQVGESGEYQVKLGPVFYGRASSLADALHELANRLDAERVFGSEIYDPKHNYGQLLRPCQYCDAPIYFAKTPKGKWLPVDGVSARAKDAKQARFRSLLVIDKAGVPTVEWLTKPQGGEVWIPHPDVCGANTIPPGNPVLRGRWESNRNKALDKQSSAVQDLQEILNDLEEEENDGT